MNTPGFHSLLADGILVLHAMFIAFVVFGLMLIVAGGICRWMWVRNLWFRIAHLLAIGVVVGESWCQIICPLTKWENQLRAAAGQVAYGDGFIEHWLHKLIFFEAPHWVFTVAYTLFGTAVVLAWIWVRPASFRNRPAPAP
ncbi:MAG: DUF2784 domain-containing protein [Verrucomicrobia bacterium]|nr:DUF2784 domain-containing protein [Verrucomicrobiota bacterium]